MDIEKARDILKRSGEYSGFYVVDGNRVDDIEANIFTLSKSENGGLDSFKVAVFDDGTIAAADGIFAALFSHKEDEELE